MADLRVFAGARAMRHIRENGLRADDINWLAGASGGPKWFVLYGLDRYLAGIYFRARKSPLRLIGSSAGAWRLACYAQADPVGALERLATFYSRQRYSARPGIHEISKEARLLLDRVLGERGAAEIADNTVSRLYIIADEAKGLLRSDNRLKLNAGLAAAAFANLASRRLLGHFFSRHVFHNALDRPGVLAVSELSTRYHTLTSDNVREALMASGSIPGVMEAVRNLPGAQGTVFRDGGITDYHLNLPFNQLDGLVLYPHFYASVVPGWFDKFAPWRNADPRYFDNVVLVTPSREYVEALPLAKIPDRNDFRRMDDDQRLQYWQSVLAASARLATAFHELVEHGVGMDEVQPFQPWRKKHV
jgi:hypothetical protein